MSFHCKSQTDAIAKATTVVGMSGTTYTMAGWFRREGAQLNNGCILYAGTSSNGLRAEMQTSGNGADIRLRHTNGFDGTDNVFVVADAEWVYVAIVATAGTWTGYGWRDTVSEDRTSLGSNGSSAITPDQFIIGGASSVAPYWQPARGEYVHFRYWNAALSTVELNAERLSATVVRSTNIIGSWSLSTSVDTSDNSGQANILTITGTTDLDSGSSFPTSIGGAPPSVPIGAIANVLARMRDL